MYQGALRIKYKKLHRVYLYKHNDRLENKFFCPKFCDLGVQAFSSGKLTNRHIETGRRFLRRRLKKSVFIKINMFPYHPFTKKPVSARMGKGKGRVYGWYFPCKSGRMLYEMKLNILMFLQLSGIIKKINNISKKMPIKVKTVRLIY